MTVGFILNYCNIVSKAQITVRNQETGFGLVSKLLNKTTTQ